MAPGLLWGCEDPFRLLSSPPLHTHTLTREHSHTFSCTHSLTHSHNYSYTAPPPHHPGNSKAVGVVRCQTKEENQGPRKTSSRCGWSLHLGVPWLGDLVTPARVRLGKETVSTLAQSPASSCPPCG